MINIRQKIEEVIPKDSQVFYLNVSSEYFVNSSYLPLKPWADTFPWYYETFNLQQITISNFEKTNIEYVVYRKPNNEGKFIPGSYLPEQVNQYIQNNYQYFVKIDDSIIILKKI